MRLGILAVCTCNALAVCTCATLIVCTWGISIVRYGGTLFRPTQQPPITPCPADHCCHVIEREALVAPYGAPLVVVLPGGQDAMQMIGHQL